MDSINDTVGSLSGGNQQKVIIGRVFAQDPRVIIAAQPTRGVDIGAIEYIHSELVKMRDAGKAAGLFVQSHGGATAIIMKQIGL